MRKTLVVGGYGNFGRRIAKMLARSDLPLVLAGRDEAKVQRFAAQLLAEHPTCLVECRVLDAGNAEALGEALAELRPVTVVNTAGPFDARDYSVPLACIRRGVHYIDTAVDRSFVTNIRSLNDAALAQGVAVVSGASTLPGLSSALVEHFRPLFASLDEAEYGFSPGQDSDAGGGGTIAAFLSYFGQPIDLPTTAAAAAAAGRRVYGFQRLHRYRYADPAVGGRWMGACDVPDYSLFPAAYGVPTVRFSAGIDNAALHLLLYAASWLVRWGLLSPALLQRRVPVLLALRSLLRPFGSDAAGMHFRLTGTPRGESAPRTLAWHLTALDGHGPTVACVPAVVLARRLAQGSARVRRGAMPCLGLVSLEEYLHELQLACGPGVRTEAGAWV